MPTDPGAPGPELAADAEPAADLERAAALVREATHLVFAAGAGMGVDSGLPDFRGDEGFWKAYPPFRRLGLSFMDLANPSWFAQDPALAWGFYGHRLELYRRTVPHDGFAFLHRWAECAPGGAFVFTSNVDGQFQRAGFPEERLVECHGTISWLQCLDECGVGLFPADGVRVSVDPETFRAAAPLPACPDCGALARPNVLMFGDGGWDASRSHEQEERLEEWLDDAFGQPGARVVAVECGAGTSVPTVRYFSRSLVGRGARLVRVNLREPEVERGHVGLALGARAALAGIDARLAGR